MQRATRRRAAAHIDLPKRRARARSDGIVKAARKTGKMKICRRVNRINGIPRAENVHRVFFPTECRFSFRKIPVSENYPCLVFFFLRIFERWREPTVFLYHSLMTSEILLMECRALFARRGDPRAFVVAYRSLMLCNMCAISRPFLSFIPANGTISLCEYRLRFRVILDNDQSPSCLLITALARYTYDN